MPTANSPGLSDSDRCDATASLLGALSDVRRLASLQATKLLDTPPEEAFDRVVRLASHLLKAPVALVSLVTADRQFFKSQKGLPEPLATLRQTPLSHSFCQHVVATAAPLVVPDARSHPILNRNLAVKEMQVVAYLGVPVKTPDGQTLGSLCTMDSQPRDWTECEVSIMQDLAFTLMSEIQLRTLAQQFHANYIALRDAELQRDDLLQMLVHDLRNPLASLLGGLELVQMGGNLEARQERYLAIARQGGQSLLRMVNDILDVGKAEAGCLGLQLAQVSVRGLIEKACAQVALLGQKSNIALVIHVGDEVPPVTADEEKLRRVLVNLISNAIQHTPKNGTIDITARLAGGGQTLVFEIADTGVGISSETFGHLFEKYGRGKCYNAGRISTGLGLPFCKLAVEAHGGTISVDSEFGEGTTFRCEIPVAPRAPKEPPSSPGTPSTAAPMA